MVSGIVTALIGVYILGAAMTFMISLVLDIDGDPHLLFGRGAVWPIYIPRFLYRSIKAVFQEMRNG